jgi:peptidoglycan/LPS O-acetylase OafA/YrhL
MTGHAISVAGIELPSSDPVFLAIVGVHVLLGLICTITGIVAMLSVKRRGPHPMFGSIYFWCLGGVFATAAVLAAIRWTEDRDLFMIGTLAFASAYLGRMARRKRWRSWARLHITGMGISYILLLTAFYVDNGKSLPIWRELPPIAYWVVPAALGIPIIIRAQLRHPLARTPRPPDSL